MIFSYTDFSSDFNMKKPPFVVMTNLDGFSGVMGVHRSVVPDTRGGIAVTPWGTLIMPFGSLCEYFQSTKSYILRTITHNTH